MVIRITRWPATRAWRAPIASTAAKLAPKGQPARSVSFVTKPDILASYPSFNLNEGGPGPRHGEEAILTLSGGVDSSVAAYMAVEKSGLVPCRTIFMRNWNSLEETHDFHPGAGGAQGCQWLHDWDVVQKMARWLDVKAELVSMMSCTVVR